MCLNVFMSALVFLWDLFACVTARVTPCGCVTRLWVYSTRQSEWGLWICFAFFWGLLCSMASLPRCLPLTTGSSCQWRLSAGKHCLRERKTGRKEPSKRETVEGRHENQRCLSVCLSVRLSIYLYILYMLYIYFSKCVCGCASQTFTGRSLGSSVSPPVKGGRIRDGEGERRGGIQAADRDLWADSVRLQAQQQSPCLCLSAHGGREWQKEWRGCWRKKWASKMSWKWKSRTREEVSQGIRQDQDWDVILFDSFFSRLLFSFYHNVGFFLHNPSFTRLSTSPLYDLNWLLRWLILIV